LLQLQAAATAAAAAVGGSGSICFERTSQSHARRGTRAVRRNSSTDSEFFKRRKGRQDTYINVKT